MNYEEFYQQAQALEKGMKEKLQSVQKSFKSITKNSAKGDLKNLSKDLEQLQEAWDEQTLLIDRLRELTEGFDGKAYMESGDFARQMIEYCNQHSVDITGDFPTYEIFPYKVKIDPENQDLYVDRKRISCLRPSSFVRDVKQSRERYMKSAFNAAAFLNELAAAYDLAVAVKKNKAINAPSDPDLLLSDLYTYLTPMQRARREYDLQNYAFDLSRLYASDAEYTKDQRRFEFGSGKRMKKLIRILDQNGNEQFLGTIRFF
jgi:hypothetical protein